MIDTVVRAACKSIFNGRFYPDTFLQRDGGLPQWPAGRYTIIDAVNAETVCGTDDQTTDDTRVQIDVVANNYAERETLVEQVIAAMMNLDPPASRVNLFKTFDEDTRTYRTVLDYIFYPSTEEAS
jgi:Protein of unknown function (DUF3168)